ncbi:MAG TPA: hypothetical protein VIE36_04230 [Methylomirabilota bacterium]
MALVGLAAIGFVNFGFFHVQQRQQIHYWDAFHYFVGAKYLPELGYTRLYAATWVAGRELGAFAGIERIRDLPTYQARDVRSIDAAAVRARFTDARWRAFKQDLLVFGPRIPDWRRLFMDHGYNDPPPRALLLHGLVRWMPATPLTLAVVTSLDYVLIAGALALAIRAFGPLAGGLAAASLLLSFFGRFDYIGGSVLRWDWIAAVIAGVAAFARGAGATAGVLFGYAAIARVFPLLLLVPFAIKWVQTRRAATRDHTLDRCLAAAAVTLTVTAVAVAAGAEALAVGEFLAKIGLHSSTPFTNHVGLGTWLVFQTAPWNVYADGMRSVDPVALAAARPAAWVVPLVSAIYLAAALPLILRARMLPSMMYAVPLVWCAVSPAGYYYSFLVLLVLLPWEEGLPDGVRLTQMALLALVSAAGYALEIVSHDSLPLMHRTSMLLALYFAVWLGLEYARRRRPGLLTMAPPDPRRDTLGALPKI